MSRETVPAPTAAVNQLARRRYHSALQRSPMLADELAHEIEATRAQFDLREEAALARTLLADVLTKVADIHATSGKLDPSLLAAIMQILRQVSDVVERASAIEAKRGDQVLDAARVALLVGSLRDDIVRALEKAGHADAAPLVVDCFARARWTGALDERTVEAALAAPTSYDVVFRVIDKAPDGKPVETGELIKNQ